jgi:hypothetical protein
MKFECVKVNKIRQEDVYIEIETKILNDLDEKMHGLTGTMLER